MPTDFHLALDLTAEKLKDSGKEFVEFFKHGSMVVELYKPVHVDKQTPHTRDEVYIIASGSGRFHVNGEYISFKPVISSLSRQAQNTASRILLRISKPGCCFTDPKEGRRNKGNCELRIVNCGFLISNASLIADFYCHYFIYWSYKLYIIFRTPHSEIRNPQSKLMIAFL